MKSKKIHVGLFTYDFFPIFGGMGRHIYEIYKQSLKDKDITLYVFSPNENRLENHITVFPETKNSNFKNIEFSIKVNKDFENIINRYKLDLIHLQGGPGGLFLFRKLSKPVIYTTHHTYWQQYHYIMSQRWKYLFYIFEKKSYQLADKIICVSKDTQKVLKKNYGIDTSHLVYIPNGIDLNSFKPVKRLSKSKELLYVGRIDKRKGIDFLVKTMVLVHQKDPEIILHIVGEGKMKQKLEEYSIKKNLPIIFHGKLSDKDLNDLYEKIAIQIVPSIFEGFGLSVIEGMAKGIPIIATDTDGIRDIVTNDKNGRLIKYGNTFALSEAIVELTKEISLQDKFVKNAYSGLKKYDWNNIYLQSKNIYEKII